MKTFAFAALAALMMSPAAFADADKAAPTSASLQLGAARAVATLPAVKGERALEKASKTGRFNTLMAAIDAAGVRDDLGQMGTYTFFAPTDAAFEKLPPGAMERLMRPENRDQLISLLRMHVVAGEELTAERMRGAQMTAETLNGPVAIDGTDPSTGVWVNAVTVSGPDIRGPDGVFVGIDTLLLPAG